MDGSGPRSDPFSLWRASDTLTQIAAELARGTPALALTGDMPWAERSSLIERLSNYLEGENIRVIVVDDPDHGPGDGGPGDGPIGPRRFCELLAAASPSSAPARDAAEHLAMIFTSPEADEHGLVLIVARADVLSTEALTFAERLATASGASPLPVQLLLLGSPALESRLPEAGSFVIQSLASIAAVRGQSMIGTARGRWRGRGLAAIGGVAALIFFLAAASGDREPEHVPEQAAAAAVVLPAHATLPVTLAGPDTSAVGAISAQPAHIAQPVTLAERDTAVEAPSLPPSGPAEPAVEPPQAASVVDAPPPVPAPPLPAAPPSAASDAPPVPTPTPPATATTEQVPAAGEPLPQAVPAPPPAADVVASPPVVAPSPSVTDAAPSAAPVASPAATQQVPADEPPPRSVMETAPVATPDNASPAAMPGDASSAAMPDDAPSAAATGDATPPVAAQSQTVTPSVTDADSVASPTETPAAPPAAAVTTERAPADVPPPQSGPEESATAGAASPPAIVQPETVAPRAVDAAIPVPSAAPAAEQPRVTPSPAAAALLARGDELIAIGDVATARVVYERAAALKSGRGATSTGRTYDPRFLHQIGAVGVVPDPAAAAAWYRKGAALGDEGAASLLGDLGSGEHGSRASQ